MTRYLIATLRKTLPRLKPVPPNIAVWHRLQGLLKKSILASPEDHRLKPVPHGISSFQMSGGTGFSL
jgi:hypothetical protein